MRSNKNDRAVGAGVYGGGYYGYALSGSAIGNPGAYPACSARLSMFVQVVKGGYVMKIVVKKVPKGLCGIVKVLFGF